VEDAVFGVAAGRSGFAEEGMRRAKGRI